MIALAFAVAISPVAQYGADGHTGAVGGPPVGVATGNVDMGGYLLTDTTKTLNLGTACTTSHSLVAGDVCIGGSGELEVDGAVWFDGLVTFGGSAVVMSTLRMDDNWNLTLGNSDDTYFRFLTAPDPDATVLSLGEDSRVLYVNEKSDRNTAYTLAQQTNPTIAIQSADATTEAQRLMLAHDQTNGVISTGAGDVHLKSAGSDVLMTDSAGTDFGLLQFGGTSVSYPALKRNGTTGLQVRSANDNRYLQLDAGIITATPISLFSGGTDDYTMALSQTLNATGAAGGSDVFRALKFSITQTDVTGWDELYAIDILVDSTSVFNVGLDGEANFYDASGDGRYWRTRTIDPSAISPGGSGATLTVWGDASIGYLLDATTEYLYATTKVCNEWDESSDIVVVVDVALNGDETANDIIQFEVLAEYFGEHDDMDTPKTQTRTVDHDIVSDNLAGEVHTMTFLLDFDLVDNVVEKKDILKLRFRMDAVAGGTDVAAVRFLNAKTKCRTSKPAAEVVTFPTEG